MRLRKVGLDSIINIVLFFYILSLYLFTYRENLFIISNILTILFVGLVVVRIVLKKATLIFDSFLFFNLLFIIFSFSTILYANNRSYVLADIRTLVLILIVMVAIVNYIDTVEKINKVINYFVFSGFITSIYVLLNSNFSEIQRFGSELGNVNDIGMIIGLSSVFCITNFLKKHNKIWLFLFLPMVSVIFLTGSRKALIFIILTILIIIYLNNKSTFIGKIRFIVIGLVFLIIVSYLIFSIPFFYNIIGIRLEGLLNLFTGEGKAESSAVVRQNMITFGLELFKEKPIFGYGAANYRSIYGLYYGSESYSHSNFIELLVNVGIVGTVLYYLPQVLVVNKILKNKNYLNNKILNYTLISIIVVYFGLGVSMVYYYNKQFAIILSLTCALRIITKKNN